MDRRAEFGQELKRQRLQRDVSLDEVARITKIRKVHLESLEEGRFEELPPSEIFVVGFVRAYANHLGLDVESLAARYREAAGASLPPVSPPKYLVVPRERRLHLWPFLLGALLLGGGWSAFWFLQQRGPAAVPPVVSGPPSVPASPPAAAAPASVPSLGDGGEPAMPQPEAPGPLQLPPSTPPPAEQDPGGDRKPQAVSGDLVVETTEPCWMEIWEGSSRAVYRLVEPGERISLNGPAFTVTLGNREAATVRWKGSPLAPPPGEGMVVSRWKIPQPTGEEVKEP